ncbi:MAG: helix-turn-helix domain-containing protein [Rhodospirillaceae bacterium]|nr:helix-turn-helix domain-containing protein [Rhodospirillaceae bacterium]
MNEAHTPAIDALALGGRIVPGDLPCLLCQARSSAVCSVLGEERIACLNDFVVRRRIDAGGRLFDEGDPAAHYFVVTEGAMMAFKEAHDGRRQITGFLYAGDMLGLNHHQRYVYSAEALNDAVVCQYEIADLRELFRAYPEVEHWLLRHCSDELASAHDQMFLLGRKNAMEKIATFLWFQVHRTRLRSRNLTLLDLPMTRRDIADYLGLTVETVSRTITRMRLAGTIGTIGKHGIDILDIEDLRQRAGGGRALRPATARRV